MRFFPGWLLVMGLAVFSLCHAQNRPLMTETVQTVEKGKARFEIGFDFLQDAVYSFSGLEGELTRLGVLGLRSGFGEKVELQLFWTAQDFLNINRRFDAPNSGNLNFSGNSTSDIGNIFVGTKARLISEKGGRPGFGIRFSVELPNSSNESGLGLDVLNFFSSLLVEKRFGKTRLLGEGGLAILEDPVSVGAQDDLLIYGFALIHSLTEKVNLLADLHGRAGSGGIGTEEQTILKVGTQVNAAGLVWDASVLFGFQDTDPSTGFSFGLSKDFSLPMFD